MSLLRAFAIVLYAAIVCGISTLPAAATGLADIGAALSGAADNVAAVATPTTAFPAVGSHGDATFRDQCAAGQFLVGFRVRAGSWVDQVAIVCAPQAANLKFGPVGYGPPRGGNGGAAPTDFTCNPDGVVTSLLPTFTDGYRQVMTIQSWCSTIAPDFVTRIKAPGEGGIYGSQPEEVCPVGQVGVGLLGNYGKHVNAVGLICGPFNSLIPPTATLPTAAHCTDFFRIWRDKGAVGDDYDMTECGTIMGIYAACAASNSYATVDVYTDTDLHPSRERQRLICVQHARDETWIQQAEHLGKGVAEGLADAMVAAAPYLGPGIEGISCVSGVVYGCAALALDIVDKTGALSDVVPKSVDPHVVDLVGDLITSVDSCTDGDITGCVHLGQAGLKAAAGAKIPGPDAVKAIAAGVACADPDQSFAGCIHLGELAAESAIPPGVFTDTAEDAVDCLNDSSTCATLGRDVTKAVATAHIPLGGLFNAALLASECSENQPDACIALGKEAAGAAGIPVDLAVALGDEGPACMRGGPGACIDVGRQAAKATGVPLTDVDDLQSCAAGNADACSALAAAAKGLSVGDPTALARQISRCMMAVDLNACSDLGMSAISRYGDAGAAAQPPVVGIVTGVGLTKHRLQVADVGGFAAWPMPQAVPPPPPAPPPAVVAALPAATTPVMKLPQGACPGREAVAIRLISVHDGSGGALVQPSLQSGQVIECLACDSSWCLIASQNPHATVSRKYLNFAFAAVPPPTPQAAPAPVVASVPPADFSGDWTTRTDKNWSYQLSLQETQQANTGTVGGTYVAQDGSHGTIDGTVTGAVLTFNWTQTGGYAGTGHFTMAADNNSFAGDYATTVNPGGALSASLLTGTWTGTRGIAAVQTAPAPAPAASGGPATDGPVDYGGCVCGGQPDIVVK